MLSKKRFYMCAYYFFFSSRRRHTRLQGDWSSDVCSSDLLSYGELDRMAATLAASLTELGLAPGDRVALYLQNVPQFVIAQCAVWKAGGVVVPLNPMLKEAELSYHLNDAGARVLICLESLYERTARS